MMCRQCGTEIAEKALLCYKCGTATTARRVEPVALPSPRPGWLLPGVGVAIVAAAVLAAWQYGLWPW